MSEAGSSSYEARQGSSSVRGYYPDEEPFTYIYIDK